VKILFDTNVLISAIITPGLSAEVLDHCIVNHSVITSEYILEELREKLVLKFDYTESEAATAIHIIRKQSVVIKHEKLPTHVSRDPDDDNILAAGVAGECDFIVTGDKDLLVLQEYQGIPILTPRAFKNTMGF
jgi:putative PIN family toxin of toxin-antitoxin system